GGPLRSDLSDTRRLAGLRRHPRQLVALGALPAFELPQKLGRVAEQPLDAVDHFAVDLRGLPRCRWTPVRAVLVVVPVAVADVQPPARTVLAGARARHRLCGRSAQPAVREPGQQARLLLWAASRVLGRVLAALGFA